MDIECLCSTLFPSEFDAVVMMSVITICRAPAYIAMATAITPIGQAPVIQEIFANQDEGQSGIRGLSQGAGRIAAVSLLTDLCSLNTLNAGTAMYSANAPER